MEIEDSVGGIEKSPEHIFGDSSNRPIFSASPGDISIGDTILLRWLPNGPRGLSQEAEYTVLDFGLAEDGSTPVVHLEYSPETKAASSIPEGMLATIYQDFAKNGFDEIEIISQ